MYYLQSSNAYLCVDVVVVVDDDDDTYTMNYSLFVMDPLSRGR